MLALLYLCDNWIEIRPGHIHCINTVPNMVISFGNTPINDDPMNFLNGRVPEDRYFGYFEDGDTVCNASGLLIYQIPIYSSTVYW